MVREAVAKSSRVAACGAFEAQLCQQPVAGTAVEQEELMFVLKDEGVLWRGDS
jgi:hypothetical protein